MTIALTKNRSQLVQEAADKLQIVGTGQTLEAEYSTFIDNHVDGLVVQLAADGIVYVGNVDAIPVEWFDSIAGLLANICAQWAGKNFDPNIKAFYEGQLRRTNSARPVYSRQTAEYF